MRDWIRRALTRSRLLRHGKLKKLERVEEPPSERVVLAVQFCMVAAAGLSAIEVAHILALRSWNPEVFVAITGLIGTITGVFLGRGA